MKKVAVQYKAWRNINNNKHNFQHYITKLVDKIRVLLLGLIIKKSGLFDEDYYLNRYLDVKEAGISPLKHFVCHGAIEGRNPQLFFDIDYYLEQNQDVRQSKINPFVHFIRFGAKENRNPHPLFDIAFYRQQNMKLGMLFMNPLAHFIKIGSKQGKNPHPLFDVSFYLNQIKEGLPANMNPLQHYLEYGIAAGYIPHPSLVNEDSAASEEEIVSLVNTYGHSIEYSIEVTIKSLRIWLLENGGIQFKQRQEPIYVPLPAIINSSNAKLKSGHIQPPDAYIGMLNKVSLVGGTRIIINSDRELLHDELADFPDSDFGIKTPYRLYKYDDGRAVAKVKTIEYNHIERGILISCDHDNNYFHWMVECLPKLLLIESFSEYDGLPILIGEELHPNFIAALNLINKTGRPIIRLKEDCIYSVDTLVYPSDLSRVLDRYSGNICFEKDVVLSGKWIRKLINCIATEAKETQFPWRKIYLTRRSGTYRRLLNEDEIEVAMLQEGYEVIDLSSCSLDYQRILFSQAKLIVAPTGATVTNLIFCKPGIKFVTLFSDHEGLNYYLWQQLATIAKVEFYYYIGKRAFVHDSFHDDFYIPIRQLVDTLRYIEEGSDVKYSM